MNGQTVVSIVLYAPPQNPVATLWLVDQDEAYTGSPTTKTLYFDTFSYDSINDSLDGAEVNGVYILSQAQYDTFTGNRAAYDFTSTANYITSADVYDFPQVNDGVGSSPADDGIGDGNHIHYYFSLSMQIDENETYYVAATAGTGSTMAKAAFPMDAQSPLLVGTSAPEGIVSGNDISFNFALTDQNTQDSSPSTIKQVAWSIIPDAFGTSVATPDFYIHEIAGTTLQARNTDAWSTISDLTLLTGSNGVYTITLTDNPTLPKDIYVYAQDVLGNTSVITLTPTWNNHWVSVTYLNNEASTADQWSVEDGNVYYPLDFTESTGGSHTALEPVLNTDRFIAPASKTFSHYLDSRNGQDIAPNDVLTAIMEDMSLTAYWQASNPATTGNATILYMPNPDGDGMNVAVTGSLPDDTNLYAINAMTTVLNGSSLTRFGYSFNCWNTQADGSGYTYVPGDNIVLNDNVKLYAMWVENDGSTDTQLTVKFLENLPLGVAAHAAGMPTPTLKIGMDSTYAITYNGTFTTANAVATNPSLVGYEFMGWATAKDGSVILGPSTDTAAVTALTGMIESTSLFAQWRMPQVVTITDALGNQLAEDAIVKILRTGDTGESLGIGTLYTDLYYSKSLTVQVNGADLADAAILQYTLQYYKTDMDGTVGTFVDDQATATVSWDVIQIPEITRNTSTGKTSIKLTAVKSGIVKLSLFCTDADVAGEMTTLIIIVPGDINLDSYLDTDDSILMKQFALWYAPLEDYAYQQIVADMDGEETSGANIDTDDAVIAEQMAIGIIVPSN